MKKRKQLLQSIESLSEAEKIEFFKMEELEARLEMTEVLPCNDSCWWDTWETGTIKC
jgi:hypothetical protein